MYMCVADMIETTAFVKEKYEKVSNKHTHYTHIVTCECVRITCVRTVCMNVLCIHTHACSVYTSTPDSTFNYRCACINSIHDKYVYVYTRM